MLIVVMMRIPLVSIVSSLKFPECLPVVNIDRVRQIYQPFPKHHYALRLRQAHIHPSPSPSNRVPGFHRRVTPHPDRSRRAASHPVFVGHSSVH